MQRTLSPLRLRAPEKVRDFRETNKSEEISLCVNELPGPFPCRENQSVYFYALVDNILGHTRLFPQTLCGSCGVFREDSRRSTDDLRCLGAKSLE